MWLKLAYPCVCSKSIPLCVLSVQESLHLYGIRFLQGVRSLVWVPIKCYRRKRGATRYNRDKTSWPLLNQLFHAFSTRLYVISDLRISVVLMLVYWCVSGSVVIVSWGSISSSVVWKGRQFQIWSDFDDCLLFFSECRCNYRRQARYYCRTCSQRYEVLFPPKTAFLTLFLLIHTLAVFRGNREHNYRNLRWWSSMMAFFKYKVY